MTSWYRSTRTCTSFKSTTDDCSINVLGKSDNSHKQPGRSHMTDSKKEDAKNYRSVKKYRHT